MVFRASSRFGLAQRFLNWPWNSPAMRRIFADGLADRPQHARQILRPDDDKRHATDEHEFSPTDIEHGLPINGPGRPA